MDDLSHLRDAGAAEVAQAATDVLKGIKARAEHVRRFTARISGGPTEESRALFECEADAEVFLRGLRGLGPDDD